MPRFMQAIGKVAALWLCAPAWAAAPALVDVHQRLPSAVLELRYASENNFLGKALYPKSAHCLLTEAAMQAVTAAAQALGHAHYRLKFFDCYRPLSVQWVLWKAFPKPGYVANPRYGSAHNRGVAVDVTLTDMDGNEVEMPTPYDQFSPQAHHRAENISAAAKKHRAALLKAMETAGFKRNPMEWWHYELPGANAFPLQDRPL